MAVQDTATVLLSYQVDQSSVALAISANQQIVEGMLAIPAATSEITDATTMLNGAFEKIATNQAFTKLAQDAAAGAISFEELANAAAALGATEPEINKLAKDITNLQAGGGGIGGGGSGGGIGIGGARSALRAGGFLLGGDAGGPVLRGVGQIATLTAVLGPVGIAAGLFAVGLRAVAEGEKKAAEEAKKYVDALHNVDQQLGAGATSDDLNKALEKAKSQKAVDEEALGNLQSFQDRFTKIQQDFIAANQNLDSTGADAAEKRRADLMIEVANATSGNITSIGQLGDAIGNQTDIVKDDNTAIGTLNIGLGTQAIKANDAAAALQLLSDEQVKSAQQDIEINNMTKAQRDEKAAQDMADIAILQDKINSGGLSYDATVALLAQEQALYEEYYKLTGVSSTYADQLEREAAAKQALTDQNQNYLDALAKEGEIRDEITKTEQDIADVRTKAAADEAKVISNGNERIAELETDAADKRAKIAQDNADAIAKIERDAGRKEFDAVADRDAVAYIKAQQQEADALDDQQQQEQKQLEAVTEGLAKQEAAIVKSEQDQIASIEDAEAQKLDELNRVHQQELVDLTNILNAEQALSLNHAIGIVSTTEYMWQAIESITLGWADAIVTGLRNKLGGAWADINQMIDQRINDTIHGGLGGGAGASAG